MQLNRKMSSPIPDQRILKTTAGDFPLDECSLKLAGKEWKILHVSAALTQEGESYFLKELREKVPYGLTLWASAIALANEIALREDSFRSSKVLELGAGTGFPGIVAASLGAKVLQTDQYELVMSVSKRNLELNGIKTIDQTLMDWTDWNHTMQYDWIIGSDILYSNEMHLHLRHIFEFNLLPNGRILLSDPFRETSFNLLEELEAEGWNIKITKWNIGEEPSLRPIGVFELSRSSTLDD